MEPTKHKFASRAHIAHIAGVCHGWCKEKRMYSRILPLSFLFGVLLFLVYTLTFGAPIAFPKGALMRVPQGKSVTVVAERLKEKHIINSTFLFKVAVRIFSGSNDKIVAGEYFFPSSENVFVIAYRLVSGNFELTPVRVTVQEGATVEQIAKLLEKKIPDFDTDGFRKLAKDQEGYLFPDTYFILPGEDPALVLGAMKANFTMHIRRPEVAAVIAASGRTLAELVTMASLLEKEAAILEDRRMIAGILWKRISIGMKLQVDAVFPYIMGKNTFELTRADLKVDSPYNTYLYKGLPPGPIASPSLEAIIAAATPVKSNYLFYLSDMQSNFHFSTTYDQHLKAQKRYLKS